MAQLQLSLLIILEVVPKHAKVSHNPISVICDKFNVINEQPLSRLVNQIERAERCDWIHKTHVH